ncbi:hypothetical protein [Hansschlegelia plantiphila]|uniref:Uncharacterized protein n=1 Tax=Hansschlegelia plantiphila TaxID=374655 RepID=A0A9W6MUJ2_9HYPH|nr:hypothetical protein [Hansschlegelia plantiphila]GLK67002.1 hypothetical protein GCM10008179_06400 [Hansschlegelia plantiphila]
MRLPPDPPVDYSLEEASGMDALMRIAWANGEISRLTTSLIGVDIPADHVETEPGGAFYQGFPGLGSMPALKQLIGGLSDDVEFSLPGLDRDLAQLFDIEADVAEGAEVYIGKVFYDERLQIVGAARWIWLGQGGEFTLERSGGTARDGGITDATQTVTLKVGSEQIIRAGAELQAWADAQHQNLHPGDKICDQTSELSQGARKAWPQF